MRRLDWLLPVLLLLGASVPATQPIPDNLEPSRIWQFDHGGAIRGDVSQKRIALIFTGGDFGEGATPILDVLKARKIKGSLFVTGDFLRKPDYPAILQRAIFEGHYVGPHSDSHPLYCPWEDRKKTLVTEAFFKSDVQKNIDDLRKLGALADNRPVYFIPPYEWFNDDQSAWAKSMGVFLFNFTPGSGSNRDWAPESEKSFVPSQKIYDDILAYEKKDPHGLNGFCLLLHLGSGRKDRMFEKLDPLIGELKSRGYSFVRIDEMFPLEK